MCPKSKGTNTKIARKDSSVERSDSLIECKIKDVFNITYETMKGYNQSLILVKKTRDKSWAKFLRLRFIIYRDTCQLLREQLRKKTKNRFQNGSLDRTVFNITQVFVCEFFNCMK